MRNATARRSQTWGRCVWCESSGATRQAVGENAVLRFKALILKAAVGSRKYAQALNALGQSEKSLITNEVTTSLQSNHATRWTVSRDLFASRGRQADAGAGWFYPNVCYMIASRN